MKFIITVDTEADNQWEDDVSKITTENLLFLPRFQLLCEQYSFKPTYLVTYEVLCDPKASVMLNEWVTSGVAGVGTHLHPWTTPPYTEKDNGKRFPSELSDEELEQKLTNLTSKFIEVFGSKPTSYRAGRWGLDDRQINILLKLGYTVDSSFTPKIDWTQTHGGQEDQGGPDFRQADVFPHYVSDPNFSYQGNRLNLLEFPMTILNTGFLKREGFLSRCYANLNHGIFRQILNKLVFRTRWLRIFNETTEADWKNIYRSAKLNKLPAIQFMIHSSELMPGGSPYNKTPQAVETFYLKLEKMFTFLSNNKVESMTITDFTETFQKNDQKLY